MAGTRIKELRKSLNLTQKDFSAKLNTSAGYISEVENGISKPGYDFLVSVFRNFNANINWLISGEGNPFNDIASAPAGAALYEEVTALKGENERLQSEIRDLNTTIKVLIGRIQDVPIREQQINKAKYPQIEKVPLESAIVGSGESARAKFMVGNS